MTNSSRPGVIRWETPDKARIPAASEWLPVADELRKHPGQWALILEGTFVQANGLSVRIRAGRDPWSPKGAFEATQRTAKDTNGRVVRVYARHVGDPADHEEH